MFKIKLLVMFYISVPSDYCSFKLYRYVLLTYLIFNIDRLYNHMQG